MSSTLPRILFVDDDATLLEGVKRSMRIVRNKFDMTFVDNPESALESYSSAPFDVVISDLHMPEMDGLELVDKMMAHKHADRTRFMFLSGAGDFDAALRAINELHVYRFLQKPIVRDSLLEAIEEGLEDIASEAAIGGRHAAAALELINAAIVVVSSEAKVLFTNPAGRRLLDQPGGLTQAVDGVCRAPRMEETQTLHSMIRVTAADPEERVRWFTIKPDEWGREVSLVAIPRTDDMAGESVILLSTDAGTPNALSREAIQHLFGLSPAEASITLAISRGERIEQAAELSGVTVSSARTYLKRVFLKTGVSRQSDLVKKILMSPAALVNAVDDTTR